MSAETVPAQANYRTEFFKLTNGSQTTLITVPTGYRYAVRCIRVCASTGTLGTCALSVTRATVEYVFNDALPVSTGLPGEEEGMPLYLETGDILKATGANNQHIFVTYIQDPKSQS
jgi:hypothetical protein